MGFAMMEGKGFCFDCSWFESLMRLCGGLGVAQLVDNVVEGIVRSHLSHLPSLSW